VHEHRGSKPLGIVRAGTAEQRGWFTKISFLLSLAIFYQRKDDIRDWADFDQDISLSAHFHEFGMFHQTEPFGFKINSASAERKKVLTHARF
jgi:hypothetical protein